MTKTILRTLLIIGISCIISEVAANHYTSGYYFEYDENGIHKLKRPYIKAVDESGKLLWQAYTKNSGEGTLMTLAYDPNSKEITVMGYYKDSLNLCGFQLKTQAEKTIFIMRVDKTGKGLWVQEVTGNSQASPYEVVQLKDGGVFLGFNSKGGGEFMDQALVENTKDYYVHLSKEGTLIWLKTYTSFRPKSMKLSQDTKSIYGADFKSLGEQNAIYLGNIDVSNGELLHEKIDSIDLILGNTTYDIDQYPDGKLALVALCKNKSYNQFNELHESKQLLLKVYSEDLSVDLSEKSILRAEGISNQSDEENRIMLQDIQTYADGSLDILYDFRGTNQLITDYGDSITQYSVNNSMDIGLVTLDHTLQTHKASTYGDEGYDFGIYLTKHSKKRGFGGCYNRSLEVDDTSLTYVDARPIPFFLEISAKPSKTTNSEVITNFTTVSKKINKKRELILAPNPTKSKGNLNIHAFELNTNQNYDLTLYDDDGLLIQQLGSFYFSKQAVSQMDVLLPELAVGLYVLVLRAPDGTYRQSRIIIE